MPHISAKQTGIIKRKLKKEFPDFKFSVRNRHHTGVYVAILEAPIELRRDSDNNIETVNHFNIDKNYEGKARMILNKIYAIVNEGNSTIVEDADYGAIPKFYVTIALGKGSKPFQVIE